MTKIKKWETIFHKYPEDYPTWKDIKHIEFQDDDRIRIDCDDEGDFLIEVEREREETDEEYEKRMTGLEEGRKLLKKFRYNQYLELKKEFEDDEELQKLIEQYLYNRDNRPGEIH